MRFWLNFNFHYLSDITEFSDPYTIQYQNNIEYKKKKSTICAHVFSNAT